MGAKGKNIGVGEVEIIDGGISLKEYPRKVDVKKGSTINFLLPWEYDEKGQVEIQVITKK